MEPDIIIRSATPDDLVAALALDPHPDRAASLEEAISSGRCLIALASEDLAGFAIRGTFFGYPFLELLVVREAHRREGIGSALVDAWERATSTDRVFTSTNRSNVAMQRLAEKAGYSRSGVLEGLDEGDPEIVYVKRLDGAAGKTLPAGGTPGNEDCSECGFRWSVSVDDAIEVVQGAPDRYSALLIGASDPVPHPGRWSPREYLWHTVDVLRLGTERLWTIALQPGSRVPGWDQDALAEARRYKDLSIPVGLHTLSKTVTDWVDAARDTPSSGWVEHPSLGALSTGDSIRRNAHEVHHHERDIRRGG